MDDKETKTRHNFKAKEKNKQIKGPVALDATGLRYEQAQLIKN